MIDFIKNLVWADFASSLRDSGSRGTVTQDCAALVLGYYRVSLREKERAVMFHPLRVGNTGGGLKRNFRVGDYPSGAQQQGRFGGA